MPPACQREQGVGRMRDEAILMELKAGYAAGKAAALFDGRQVQRVARELDAIETAVRDLRKRLDEVAATVGGDDGWHH